MQKYSSGEKIFLTVSGLGFLVVGVHCLALAIFDSQQRSARTIIGGIIFFVISAAIMFAWYHFLLGPLLASGP